MAREPALDTERELALLVGGSLDQEDGWHGNAGRGGR